MSVQMFLGILPVRLTVSSVSRTALRSLCYRFLPLFLSPPPFFLYTETESSASTLIMDARAGGKGLGAAFSETEGCAVSSCLWRAVQVSPGSEPLQAGGIVSAVSGALAAGGFSILYASSVSSDFVLVKAGELEAALACLQAAFAVVVEMPTAEEEEEHRASGPGDARAKEEGNEEEEDVGGGGGGDNNDDEAKTQQPHSLPSSVVSSAASSAAPGAISLQTLPDALVLMTLPEGGLDGLTRRLLSAVFYPDEAPRAYFSFVHIEGEGDMVVADQASADLLGGDDGDGSCAPPGEEYRALRVEGEWGFEETGLVYSVSEPLTRGGVPVFYSSTFSTDYCLVQETRHAEAVDILRKHGMA